MLRVDFVTLFPELVLGALRFSMMERAVTAGLAEFHAVNPRDFTADKRRTVDDEPFGGGPGMVMMATPIIDAVKSLALPSGTPVILLDPSAEPFRQAHAERLAKEPRVALICGHYEGVDERVRELACTHTYSVFDFVTTGGEVPALAVTEAIVRLLPGALGSPESHEDDSYSTGLLGHPLYTRPETVDGAAVPAVMRSGDHAEIARWRRSMSLRRTRDLRPDLFSRADLTEADLDLL